MDILSISWFKKKKIESTLKYYLSETYLDMNKYKILDSSRTILEKKKNSTQTVRSHAFVNMFALMH